MMNGADPGLRVFLGEQPIARLQQHEDQLLWHYEPHWLQQGFDQETAGDAQPWNLQEVLAEARRRSGINAAS